AEHVLEGALGERLLQALATNPGPVALGPALGALPVDVPVAQQLLGHAVAGVLAGPPEVLAAAHQVPEALLRRRGRAHEGQLARAEELDQLARVAPVGLDPRARPDRGERGGDDEAGHA